MIIETLRSLFRRDLMRLHHEIALYKNEAAIWRTGGSVTNSAGNLCLHLAGNLNTYIGKELGGTGYQRNREQEFSLKDVPQKELLALIEHTVTVVDEVLAGLSDESLEKQYPVLVFEEKTSTGYLLIHLATHLTYHLGQVNYHRRLLDA